MQKMVEVNGRKRTILTMRRQKLKCEKERRKRREMRGSRRCLKTLQMTKRPYMSFK